MNMNIIKNDIKRLNGTKDLIFDAVEETTNLVERMHALAARNSVRPFTLVEPLATLVQAIKTAHDLPVKGIYETIRIVNRGIKKLLDVSAKFVINEVSVTNGEEKTRHSTPLRSDAKGSRSWSMDYAESALNALYGDYLAKRDNDLDIGMSFRHQGRILPVEREAFKQNLPDCTKKVCIFIHGLGCTDWAWSISAERFYGDPVVNFGSQLKDDLGFTPLYIRYNTGRHISQNGQLLSALLTQLVGEYPKNIEKIVLVGHSMGGLVARSASHYGNENKAPWVSKLRHIFCLGSPNLGAPLEKATNLLSSLLRIFETAGTQAPAQVLNSRSAGIKDLRFGYSIDDEWKDKDPDAFLKDNRCNVPFVDNVGYYFIASTINQDPNHPVSMLFGDMLVRLPSATGHASKSVRRIPFHSGYVFTGMNHLHMANHPDVYKAIRQFIEKGKS